MSAFWIVTSVVVAAVVIRLFFSVRSILIPAREAARDVPIANSEVVAAEPYRLVDTRHGPMLANVNDIYIGQALIEYGECCEIEGELIDKLMYVKPGKVIEVGANVGIHSVSMAKSLAEVGRQLVLFEPQPFIFQNLCANLALNGLSNVVAWPFACGAEEGIVYFTPPDYRDSGNFGGVSMVTEGNPEAVAVPCVCLDRVIGNEDVSLLKIDVEGFELDVLKGAVNLLQRARPLVYVENDRREKSRDLIEYLLGLDYLLYWHSPPLFNPDNYKGKKINHFDGLISLNMLAIPKEVGMAVEGLEEVRSADEFPISQ